MLNKTASFIPSALTAISLMAIGVPQNVGAEAKSDVFEMAAVCTENMKIGWNIEIS